ncbi:endonuclease domain-containing protein [Sphingomonas sp.]|uniref:endonuclease domain-containing protein n=1 Tax=Sphingomonas sp. TaxID=28214 RepID=UPI0037512947
MRRIAERLTGHARDLRNDGTRPERILWRLLSRYRPRFTRQLVVGPYIVDLACRTARVAVELDGDQHALAQGYDARRTAFLEAEGWVVVRYWNSDVVENAAGVADAILRACAERLEGTHPQPLPSREGRTRQPRSRKSPSLPEEGEQGSRGRASSPP